MKKLKSWKWSKLKERSSWKRLDKLEIITVILALGFYWWALCSIGLPEDFSSFVYWLCTIGFAFCVFAVLREVCTADDFFLLKLNDGKDVYKAYVYRIEPLNKKYFYIEFFLIERKDEEEKDVNRSKLPRIANLSTERYKFVDFGETSVLLHSDTHNWFKIDKNIMQSVKIGEQIVENIFISTYRMDAFTSRSDIYMIMNDGIIEKHIIDYWLDKDVAYFYQEGDVCSLKNKYSVVNFVFADIDKKYYLYQVVKNKENNSVEIKDVQCEAFVVRRGNECFYAVKKENDYEFIFRKHSYYRELGRICITLDTNMQASVYIYSHTRKNMHCVWRQEVSGIDFDRGALITKSGNFYSNWESFLD